MFLQWFMLYECFIIWQVKKKRNSSFHTIFLLCITKSILFTCCSDQDTTFNIFFCMSSSEQKNLMVSKKHFSVRVLAHETYLSESVAVSFSGSRNNNTLSPVLAIEVLQVLLDGLQPGQFSGEVNGSNSRMVGVPVQSFFQGLVDLIQGAQEELQSRNRQRWCQGRSW